MPKVNPIPDGLRTVTPHLVCANAADAIEFYKKAFGAVEVSRIPGPKCATMYAQVRIGDSAVFLVDAFPEWGSLGPESLKSSPVTMHLYVSDADAAADRAVKAGARGHDAGGGSVLGRPLRLRARSVRPQLVARHPRARREPRGDGRIDVPQDVGGRRPPSAPSANPPRRQPRPRRSCCCFSRKCRRRGVGERLPVVVHAATQEIGDERGIARGDDRGGAVRFLAPHDPVELALHDQHGNGHLLPRALDVERLKLLVVAYAPHRTGRRVRRTSRASTPDAPRAPAPASGRRSARDRRNRRRRASPRSPHRAIVPTA